MHFLALLGLASCLLQGVLSVRSPSFTQPTTSTPPISNDNPVKGRNRRHPRKIDLILKRLTPDPPAAVDDDVPENFTPSENFTKRGDYPPYVDIAVAFTEEKNPGINFDVAYSSESERDVNVYLEQTHHGLNIDSCSGRATVSSKDNTIYDSGNNFYREKLPEDRPLDTMNFRGPLDALRGLIATLKLRVHTEKVYAEPVPGKTQDYVFKGLQGVGERAQNSTAKLVYWVQSHQIFLTWAVLLDVWVDGDWEHSFGAYVDARHPSRIIAAWDNVDYLTAPDSEFLVFPWGVMDPEQGNQELIKDPWTLEQTSRLTWLSDGHQTYNTTRGNNVYAYGYDADGEKYHPVPATHNFTYAYKKDAPHLIENLDAAIVQAFYTANMYHDVLYRLGFDEKHGNYQENNDGRGGPSAEQGDFVKLRVQVPGPDIENNAAFYNTMDGSPGTLELGLDTKTYPPRDMAFDAQTIIHEYTHGLTHRLLDSNPSMSGLHKRARCIIPDESAGMGEGWSDFMAVAMSVKNTRERSFTMFGWQDPEVRSRPYSTNLLENSYTFASLNEFPEDVYSIGEVWATILHEVMWSLIDKLGLGAGPYPELDDEGYPTDGRFLAMKLVMKSMRRIKCPQTLLHGRTALLSAAQAYAHDTGHNVECDLWKAFAKRGMGWDAKGEALAMSIEDSFQLPGKCDARAWLGVHEDRLGDHTFRIKKWVEFRDELNLIRKKQDSEEAKRSSTEDQHQNRHREEFLLEIMAALSSKAPHVDGGRW